MSLEQVVTVLWTLYWRLKDEGVTGWIVQDKGVLRVEEGKEEEVELVLSELDDDEKKLVVVGKQIIFIEKEKVRISDRRAGSDREWRGRVFKRDELYRQFVVDIMEMMLDGELEQKRIRVVMKQLKKQLEDLNIR